MQKIYSLLRNNKQSGPYTLEELLQLKLKPFDLVWVEGKSGGWSYPTEVEALKIYVTEAPKPVEIKEAVPQSHSLNEIPETINKPEINALQPIASTSAAKHIYISLPAGTHTANPGINRTLPLTEITEEESPDAKLERKAQELRDKIQAFAEKKNQPKADNDLDIKYARSLDDIKEEYSSWLYQKRKKKNIFPKKSVLVVGVLAFLLLVGYFVIPPLLNPKTNNRHILSAQEIAAAKPDFTQTDQTQDPPAISKKNSKTTNSSQKKKSKPANQSSKTYSNKGRNKIDNYIDSLKEIENNKTEPVEEVTYEPISTDQDGSRQSTKRDDGSTVKKVPTTKENTSSSISELIKLSESTGSGSPHLSLYNNSNKHINFVAVDVYYYKSNQKLLRKKTLYFKDISPRSSARLFVPKERNAASVRYEMGLISSEGSLYYAKQ